MLSNDVDYAIANRVSEISNKIKYLNEFKDGKLHTDIVKQRRYSTQSSNRDIYNVITSRTPLVSAVKLLVSNYRIALPLCYYAFISEMKAGNVDALKCGNSLPKINSMVASAGISSNYDLFSYFYNPSVAKYPEGMSLDAIQNEIINHIDNPIVKKRNEFAF